MSNQKFKYVYKLLSDRHLTVVSDVKDNMKCGICNNILIDAHLTTCGCNFCKACIDEYRKNGGLCCPGDRYECKSSDLSNILVDNRVNREISRLIVRCTEDRCGFECELIDMESHLEVCSKKKIICPFRIVGCDEHLNEDKMNQHLMMESYNHNKLLMEMINNLRNEINELRDNDRRNKDDINRLIENMDLRKMENKNILKDLQNLKEETKRSDENLLAEVIDKMRDNKDSLNEDIQILWKEMTKKSSCDLLKAEIDDLEMRMKSREENVHVNILNEVVERRLKFTNKDFESIISETDKTRAELKKQEDLVRKEIGEIKAAIKENLRSIEKFHLQRKADVEKLKEVNKNEIQKVLVNERPWNEDIKSLKMNVDASIAELKDCKSYDKLKVKMNQLEKDLNRRLGIFVWYIEPIDTLEKHQSIDSDFFYFRNHLYQMGLQLNLQGDEVTIRLLIYKAEKGILHWPFKARLAISICDQTDSYSRKTDTKEIVIDEPIDDQYNSSDDFTFTRPNLMNFGLWSSSNCFIECCIDHEQLS